MSATEMRKHIDSFRDFISPKNDSSIALWETFKGLYVEELKKSSNDKLKEILTRFGERSIRTEFNREIIHGIAKNIELGVNEEVLQIDFALTKTPKSGYPIPIIFVEHENDISSEPTNHEISKLCFTNAPLKVFITWISGDWENERKNSLDDFWWYMVASYQEVYGDIPGTLGLIVGEVNSENKTVKYFSERWDENHKWEDGSKGAFTFEEIIFEHKIEI